MSFSAFCILYYIIFHSVTHASETEKAVLPIAAAKTAISILWEKAGLSGIRSDEKKKKLRIKRSFDLHQFKLSLLFGLVPEAFINRLFAALFRFLLFNSLDEGGVIFIKNSL